MRICWLEGCFCCRVLVVIYVRILRIRIFFSVGKRGVPSADTEHVTCALTHMPSCLSFCCVSMLNAAGYMSVILLVDNVVYEYSPPPTGYMMFLKAAILSWSSSCCANSLYVVGSMSCVVLLAPSSSDFSWSSALTAIGSDTAFHCRSPTMGAGAGNSPKSILMLILVAVLYVAPWGSS
mmetsp:Transcript_15465/g.25283  ORF Transcript_15465/g.25283 Transcript_15465/m.25283 type:complete len:179 (-) Transcript_15465:557-1093(-)